jgi:hypothetical protein
MYLFFDQCSFRIIMLKKKKKRIHAFIQFLIGYAHFSLMWGLSSI